MRDHNLQSLQIPDLHKIVVCLFTETRNNLLECFCLIGLMTVGDGLVSQAFDWHIEVSLSPLFVSRYDEYSRLDNCFFTNGGI